MLRTRISRAALCCGAVAIALLGAGCQGTVSGQAADPAVPTFPTPETRPAEPPASQPPATARPTTGAATRPPVRPMPTGPAECKVADLELSLGNADATAGKVYRQLRFTNVGRRTCVIQGFPGVSYVAGDDGHQVGPAAYREGPKGPPVTLEPGMTAFAPVGFVQVRNFDPAECRPTEVRGLRVYPPHEYDSMFLPAPGVGCAGTPPDHQLTVRTVQPA